MAYTLEDLIAQLNQSQTAYTPLTQEEMELQARNRYQSDYDQKRLSARQTYETSDAALLRELSGLQASYDRERAQSAADYRALYAQTDRQALSRGMQRSSYNNATLANVGLQAEAAQQEISGRQTAQESGINEQRSLLSQQLGQTLQSYDAGQRSDILSYIDQLEAREYDRMTQRTSEQNKLLMQLYEYQHQLEQEAAEQARWQKEFDAKYGAASASGGGGRRTSSSSAASGVSEAAKLAAAMAALGGVAALAGR